MLKKVREYIVICPGCLTWETLWFKGNSMEPSKRFTRGLDSKVYHDCGLTDKPCRLYPRFIGEKYF
jgi:hypothetical protein